MILQEVDTMFYWSSQLLLRRWSANFPVFSKLLEALLLVTAHHLPGPTATIHPKCPNAGDPVPVKFYFTATKACSGLPAPVCSALLAASAFHRALSLFPTKVLFFVQLLLFMHYCCGVAVPWLN